MGVARSTFVIDAAGRIAQAFTALKPAVPAAEVLAAVAAVTSTRESSAEWTVSARAPSGSARVGHDAGEEDGV